MAPALCVWRVWGEASPQVPPEARWTVGRSRGASQPWVEGGKEKTTFHRLCGV